MTKARLHPSLIEFRGAMRDMVFKQRNGKLYASVKSTGSTKEPTAAQAAHRERFRKAVRYGKLVMSNDTVRPLYELVAAERNIPVFTVCITDYMKAPSIDEIDVHDYNGRRGDPVKIVASDDFGVVRVDVKLTDEASGTIIENGQAVETDLGEWIYIATESIDAGSTVQFQVTASDRPGGAAVQTETKRI